MIFKETWINVADNTNVRWVQVFQLYKGFNRKTSTVGYFIKGSARVVEPPRIEYKGFKFKFNKKGDICRGLIIRVKYNLKKLDGRVIYFKNNSIILLKKKQEVKSKYLHGPITQLIRRRKFLNLFNVIL
jgi:large subunit ribosomal protein L14